MRDGRRFRYPRSARVRRGPEIRSLLRDGSRRRSDHLEIFRAGAKDSTPRAGIIVPRYGHTIVRRNQLKRRLRECVRILWLPEARRSERADDILIRARPSAYDADFSELRAAFLKCAGGKS